LCRLPEEVFREDQALPVRRQTHESAYLPQSAAIESIKFPDEPSFLVLHSRP